MPSKESLVVIERLTAAESRSSASAVGALHSPAMAHKVRQAAFFLACDANAASLGKLEKGDVYRFPPQAEKVCPTTAALLAASRSYPGLRYCAGVIPYVALKAAVKALGLL